MARRTNGKPPSDTLTRLLAGQDEIKTELDVIRLGQEHLTTPLTRMTEGWTGMFRQLGLQIDLLATRIGDNQDLRARVDALEHRLATLEGRAG